MVRGAAVDGCGPVLAALLAVSGADDVLRRVFDEADVRTTSVAVLAAGTAARDDCAAAVEEAVARWSEKYPGLPVRLTARAGCDPAIALTAATTGCVLAVVAEPADSRAAAVVASVERRAHCPIVVLHHGEAGMPYPGEGKAG